MAKEQSSVRFKRKKTTSRAVMIADYVADRVITIGGILVIIAVLGILVFLVAETLPLFQGGKITAEHEYSAESTDRVLGLSMDEYKTMLFTLFADGTTHLYHAKTGEQITAPQIDFEGKQIQATTHTIDQQHWAFGFADGTVRLAEAHFVTDIITPQELPQNLQQLDDRDSTDGVAIYSRIPGNQFRKIVFEFNLGEPLAITETQKPLIALDYRVSGKAERQLKAFAVVDSEGQVTLNLAKTKINLLTNEQRTTVDKLKLPDLPEGVCENIHSVLLTKSADSVMVADGDGIVYRYNTRDINSPIFAEKINILSPNTTLTTFDFLLGEQAIVAGGSDGSLGVFFILDREDANTEDGQSLIKGRTFASSKSPIVGFAPSERGKSFAVAFENGDLRVLHGTSQKVLAQFSADDQETAYQHILMAPRFDGLLAFQKDNRIRFWEFDVPHPETTFRTLFQKVWYEGYPEPTYTWQSTGATEDFESKFSMTPLIFGTIKAAFYSLLFAIPIAILGAIYTSEFLHFRVRGVVKPVMEMMASLPSVVLGFVAALVLAPIVETWIGAVILAFVALPLALMLSAFLWQLLPLHLANRWRGIPKFSLMIMVVLIGVFVTYQVGLVFEAIFFGGDFKAWLAGKGTATPFLFLILLPITFTIITLLVSRFFGHRITQFMGRIPPFKAALFDMAKWGVMVVGTLGCSYLLAEIFTRFGIDARGSFVGTYVQRNTLIVGFAMGFAVIPIIYTIAEDALNAVPQHLRAASLGCGATQWQTAIYVILPTALSGVFSAIMIGMGRAVGETMIVVMAAGNTPILDWNIFNGLRALSATIAVELPEAVKDGTLYRILFLSGLVLFAMTFVINTVAEVVRIRFRKRAAQL
jgi:phosphate transport system permease protein